MKKVEWKQARYGVNEHTLVSKGRVRLAVYSPITGDAAEQTYKGLVTVESRSRDFDDKEKAREWVIKHTRRVFEQAIRDLDKL